MYIIYYQKRWGIILISILIELELLFVKYNKLLKHFLIISYQ